MSRHSNQRDAVYTELCARCDHPTAEDIYITLKPTMPALSLSTVYRNLDRLVSEGKALRFPVNGTDRFDGDTSSHPHFICEKCGCVIDIVPDGNIDLKDKFSAFGGKINTQSVIFRGLCPGCTLINQ